MLIWGSMFMFVVLFSFFSVVRFLCSWFSSVYAFRRGGREGTWGKGVHGRAGRGNLMGRCMEGGLSVVAG